MSPFRRHRRLRTAAAAVASAVLAVATVGCTPDASEPSQPTPVPSAASAGSGTPTAAPDLRLGAPVDCVVNAYCAVGLADVYGFDVSGSVEPHARIADSVAALKAGNLDLAVVFSGSPYPTDPELLAVEDDKAMVAADNVVPVYRRSLGPLFGGKLADQLDGFSELLRPAALAELDALVAGGASPKEAAKTWLDQAAPAPRDAKPVEGPRLRIGGADFLESRVLAEAIAGFLADRGFRTRVVTVDGGRHEVVDALANGRLDIAPEYTAALLEYLNGGLGEAADDEAANYRRLADYTELIGVSPARMALANSANVFVTTRTRARELNLRRLSDLANLGVPTVSTKTRPGIQKAPAELGILVRSVGHQLAAGSSGPEVRDLQRRLKQLDFDVKATGTYDADTVAAVRTFQGQQGLAPTGVVKRSTEKALADPKPLPKPNPVRPGDGGAARPPRGAGKVIYLTFDDGPGPRYTQEILDLLDRYQAKATFFELGANATANPGLTRAVLKRGHALASHTWDHADMTGLSATALQNEISHTSRALEKIAGRPITCLRPPYGANNARVRSAIARNGLTMWLWDIDPQDWSRPGVASIRQNVLSHAHPGAVSLMHDGGGDRSQSVAALRQVLSSLARQGYRFEALPGC